MTYLSDTFLVETLFSGRVRIVTPDGETFVSNGRPDADKVLAYLDKGCTPKGSAKWTFAGRASHEDLVRLADNRAFARNLAHGCEYCDGEGGHDASHPCG